MKHKFLLWPLSALIALHVALALSGCGILWPEAWNGGPRPVPPVKTNAPVRVPITPPMPPAATAKPALRPVVAPAVALPAAPITNFVTFKYFLSPTNCVYSIQASTNLADWIQLSRFPGGGDGWRSFVDVNTNPARFYRIIRY